MVAAQGRIADTIDVFYGAADRTSEGAMAANAYKRSVDELQASNTREFVRLKLTSLSFVVMLTMDIHRTRHFEHVSWNRLAR